MSIKLDSMIAETGTKFKIFSLPRNLKSFEYPETIRVSVNPQMMEEQSCNVCDLSLVQTLHDCSSNICGSIESV